jgi:glycosyltransferase involved in cell wall biosynthesis
MIPGADQNATVVGTERASTVPAGRELSLVVPVYNERDALPGLLDETERVCNELGVDWEIVVVDDGSTDGSAELLEQHASRRSGVSVVRLRRNFGKSAALTAGFDHSFGEIVVTLDGDGQDDPAEIPALIRKLDEGYDLVSGWKRRRRDPALKRWSSRLFNRVTGRLSGLRLHDLNCGLKAYRGRCARSLEVYGELHRFIPVLAAQQGWRVTEVPVEHRPRIHGRSKFGAARYPRGLFDLMTVLFIGRYRQRPLHFFGGVGLILMVMGVAISSYLAILKISGQSIGQRPLLLLGALLIVVGAQFLTFGLLGQLMTAIGHDSGRPRADGYEVERVVDAGGLVGEAAGEADGRTERVPTPSVPQGP